MNAVSKFTKPSYTAGIVERPRLYRSLDRWRTVRGILIHAPAGYGKSSLVSRWIDYAGHSGSAAWLALDQDDDEPREFVRTIAAALDTVIPGSLALVQPILQDTQGSAQRALSGLLAALEVGSLQGGPVGGGDVLLALDDLHLIESPDVLSLVVTVLERGPSCLHLMLIARQRATLPLARLVSHEDLLVITRDELRFTEDEVGAYLERRDFAAPTNAEVMQVTERSEGWVTALQLARLSLRGGHSVADLLAALHGRGDWLAQFLADEVLNLQSPALHRFLLRTSILDRFDVQLCAAVMEDANPRARLLEVKSADLFLIQLDREGQWFRYHHLFQELLQHRLEIEAGPVAVAELHRRAAAALAEAGHVEDAVRHLLLAGDMMGAAALIEAELATTVLRDPYRAQRLLDLLPLSVQLQHPRMAVDRCRIAMIVDSVHLLEYVEQAEETVSSTHVESTDQPLYRFQLSVLRAIGHYLMRDYGAAFAVAEAAQRFPDKNDQFLLGALYFVLTRLEFRSGEIEGGQHSAQRALEAFQAVHSVVGEVALRRELAHSAMAQGQGREAAKQFARLLDGADHEGSSVNRELAWANFLAAENCYWMDELEQALVYQRSMMMRASRLQDDELIGHADALADCCAATGRAPDERISTSEAQESADAAIGRVYYLDVRVRTLVATDQSDVAWNLVQRHGLVKQLSAPDYAEPQLFPYLHAYLARGVAVDDVSPILADALAHRVRIGARFDQLRLLSLAAWQQQQLGDQGKSFATLAQAARLAQETGYTRVLLDIPALMTVLSQRGIRLTPHIDKPAVSASLEVDSVLTAQERQVLNLLSADRTYQQIADELVISINTVRTHVRNIYRKLGVHRREQMIVQAARMSRP